MLIRSIPYFAKKFRKNFIKEDVIRLITSPGSPVFPVVSAFVIPALLLTSFASFAFHFSAQLTLLSRGGADVFVLNLLEKDLPFLPSVSSSGTEVFSIIRGRIVSINGAKLEDHLQTETPPREFSREFNITASPLSEKILAGKKTELAPNEVSVDEEFASQLRI